LIHVQKDAVRLVTYSAEASPADWRAVDVVADARGSRFTAVGPDGSRTPVRTRLPGGFNVPNALAALAALVTAGIPADTAATGFATLPGVPGRMELVDVGQPFLALVDYAHTPVAVSRLLAAARSLTDTGRVIVVLGCGGDRDRAKRPLMGRAAAEHADLAVFTSDNPRSEDPDAIIAAMLTGATGDIPGRIQVEPDRRLAIEYAVNRARPGDVVVVAGKGHERGQEFADHTVAFDDRLALRAALGQLVQPGSVA
jgi:UDP-N-acetylmuramoyl-L-alanyl-D-glutamate--2,6-diaminopimelate ligase